MTSRESSLGAWADKIPQVETWRGQQPWEAAASEETAPLSPAELGLELKGLGTLLLVGVALLLASGFFLAMNLEYVVNGKATTGIVVDHRLRPRGARAPVVAYFAEGKGYRFVSTASAGRSAYPVGDEVLVLYLPDDPSEATIGDFTNLYLLPTILGSGGMVFFVGGIVLGVYVVKKAGWRLLPARR
jgi:hypothetical protein